MVFLAGAAVRAYLIGTTVIVARDGITFVKYAQGLRTDPVGEMRRQDQHPLYPTTVLVVHAIMGPWLSAEPVFSWPIAGQIASLLGGMLVIWAAYAIGKAMWDPRVGLITALFAAVLPDLCQVSANALSDGLHLGLYLWGLGLVLRALQTNRMRWLAVAALFSGLAFLVRPEGGSILMIGLATVALAHRDQGWSWRRRAVGGLILILCFSAVAGPYMVAVGRVVQKKNVFELFGLDEGNETAAGPLPSGADRTARADASQPVALRLLYYWGRACRVVYLLLALPALTLRVVPRPRGLRAVLLAALLHICLLCALYTSFGYLSLRHLLVLAALTLPFAAATFAWLIDQVSILLAFRHDRRARRIRPFVYLLGVLAVVGPTTPWILRPLGGGHAYIIAAGRWLHENSRPGETVLTTRSRVAYYAELTMHPGPDTGSIKHLTSYIRQLRPDYFVVEESHVTASDRNPNFFADLNASALADRLKLIHEEPGQTGKVLIYRVKSSAPRAGATTSPQRATLKR